MVTSKQTGAVNPLLAATIALIVVLLITGSFAIWAFVNYKDQKNNVDQKVAVAVTNAKQVQTKIDEVSFIEREKQPYRTFSGPADFGSIKLDYPKTWSGYVKDDGPNEYEAYFQPGILSPIESTAVALHLQVQNRSYEQVVNSYKTAVKKGDLVSTAITINGIAGVRLDGTFSDTVQGAAVIFKIRDKSLILSTEAPAFKGDFDNVILKSLSFSP